MKTVFGAFWWRWIVLYRPPCPFVIINLPNSWSLIIDGTKTLFKQLQSQRSPANSYFSLKNNPLTTDAWHKVSGDLLPILSLEGSILVQRFGSTSEPQAFSSQILPGNDSQVTIVTSTSRKSLTLNLSLESYFVWVFACGSVWFCPSIPN